MKELRAIILAAGQGTRMKSECPKVLHPICGRPMLSYVLDAVKKCGCAQSVVVLGHKAANVEKILPKGTVAVEQKKLLGTADAAKCALKKLKNFEGDLLVVCGDTPLLRAETLKKLVKEHKETGAAATILTAVIADSRGYGRIIRGIEGDPVAIREEKDASAAEKKIIEINSGVYCFKAASLAKVLNKVQLNAKKKEFYLTDVIELMADERWKISAFEMQDFEEGHGVNDRVGLARCQEIIRRRILEAAMLGGVTVEDPQTTFIDASARIGKDTVVKPFTVIESDVVIGKNCVIGPFAHLRQQTKIGDRTEIGNFAEVSRATIGADAFMKHFSFVGDAKVGDRANIGAGAVTANFDGKDKHKTQIGDDAFIGSGAVLVAPAKVGKGAVVGAGCVAAKEKIVPDNAVMVGVPGRVINKKKKR